MTAEHLTLLEPNDLRAMRIVCKKCRGSILLQLNETIGITPQCPVCNEPWQLPEPHGSRAPQAAAALGNALKAWLAIEAQKPVPHFYIRFELTEFIP